MPKAIYTVGSIEGTMLKTATAMLPATIAISGYNIADTYFVAQLGTLPLAAMGFTFPAIMLFGCINRGFGTGTTTPLAHALGGGKKTKAAKIVGAGLLLIILWSLFVGVSGYFTINWTFRQFGAGEKVLPFIYDYMSVWYLGCLAGAISMTCNNILIAASRSKSASSLMLSGMFLNVVLDPILIFGWGPVPSYGIRGAAIATVISQSIASAVSLFMLHYRLHLINFTVFQNRLLKSTWSVIMRMAFPSIIGMLMMPIGNGIMIRIVAFFGTDAVAACAAAARLEIVSFIIPMALGISLTPIVAQNYGGRYYLRINQCRRFSMRFAFIFEFFMGCIFFVWAPWIAGLFSRNTEVIRIMTIYLRIVPWGFGLMEIHRYGGFFFTGCNRPKAAAWLNALRIVFLLIPFSLIALYFRSLTGLFTARLVADIMSGLICIWLVKNLVNRLIHPQDEPI